MWKMICASRCQDTSEGSMVVIWAPNRKESIEAREEDNEQTDIVRSVRGFSVTRRLRTLRFWPRNSLLFSQVRRSALPGQSSDNQGNELPVWTEARKTHTS